MSEEQAHPKEEKIDPRTIGIQEFIATHEVIVPDPAAGWTVWTHGLGPKPRHHESIVTVKSPHHRCVIENELPDGRVAVRFLTPVQHIEAYPSEWVKPLA